MSTLNIVTIPSDLLFKNSEPVKDDEFGEELEKKMSEMTTTMYAEGGVGLAGVQVGDLRRILVADLGHVAGTGYRKESIKMVNPVLLESSEETITVPEGCLSYPGLTQKVTRPKRITVSYRTPDGESHEQEFEDFQAIVIQHEMDHLDGVTLFSRASAFKRRMYKQKVEKKLKKYAKQLKRMMSRHV